MYRVFEGLKVLGTIKGSTGGTTMTPYLANSITVFNDGSSDVRVTVNGIWFDIKPGDPPFDECFEPFKTFTIAIIGGTSCDYRIILRG